MIIFCVWIISSPCQQRPLFLGLLQYQGKEAASSEDKCSYSIKSYNTKQLEQTFIIIDYKERVSKASFVIGQLYTFLICTLSIEKAFQGILREEILHRMDFHKESEMFLSVYSRINKDFKIIVPQKRNSTQSTSTVMNKLFMHN